MIDRFRHLPCGLHEALAIPWDVPWREAIAWKDTEQARLYQIEYGVDLATGPGWDHAVRAYAAIRGGSVDDSDSVSFEWGPCGWELVGARVPPQAEMRFPGVRFDTPAGRREALCRCICAALNLRVEEVFPA